MTSPERFTKTEMHRITYNVADQNAATTKSIGIYNFSVQLARQLAGSESVARLDILANPYIESDLTTGPRTRISQHSLPVRHRLGRMIWDQWALYSAAWALGNEWLFLPKGFASFIRRPRGRLAAFVHDTMGDYYQRHYAGFESPAEFLYFDQSLRATLRHAQVIFTNTRYTQSQIEDYARRRGLAPQRIVPIGYGFDAVTPKAAHKTESIVLFASQAPHKRTDLAVELLTNWLAAGTFSGVINCIGIFSDRIKKPDLPAFRWIGRVPPTEGKRLMREARAIVYTSEYEGFGMPPVEAVLEGTCPVYSDIPPLREVMGEAGCAFSNQVPHSFVAAMERALRISREELEGWRTALQARHNWPAVAARFIEALSS
jgi:hypothetical protein